MAFDSSTRFLEYYDGSRAAHTVLHSNSTSLFKLFLIQANCSHSSIHTSQHQSMEPFKIGLRELAELNEDQQVSPSPPPLCLLPSGHLTLTPRPSYTIPASTYRRSRMFHVYGREGASHGCSRPCLRTATRALPRVRYVLDRLPLPAVFPFLLGTRDCLLPNHLSDTDR